MSYANYDDLQALHGKLCVSITDRVLCLGEVVLYTWVEWLKEQQHLWAPASEPEQVPPERPDSDAELADAVQQVGSCSNHHPQFHLASILGSNVAYHVTIPALRSTST